MTKVKLVIAVGRKKIDVNKQIMMEMIWDNKKYMVVALVVKDLFSSLVLGLDWL